MYKTALSLFTCLSVMTAWDLKADSPKPQNDSTTEVVQGVIRDLVDDNQDFFKSKAPQDFTGFLDIQNPRTTLVLCSDSRVQVDNFSGGAENDVFVVRDIGNQIPTAKGSVEYGVNILKTPVLLIVGHSHCGAVQAARQKDLKLPPAIQKELSTLNVKEAPDDKAAVILNVNQQVEMALDTFKERVDRKDVVIIGAVYDFRNDYGLGKGRLIIVNLNGKTNPQEIRDSQYFDGIQDVTIGEASS